MIVIIKPGQSWPRCVGLDPTVVWAMFTYTIEM